MIAEESKSEKTLDEIADEIALGIADGPDSENALNANNHGKIVNAAIVRAGEVHHPELAKLRRLVSEKVKQLLR